VRHPLLQATTVGYLTRRLGLIEGQEVREGEAPT
jgi:hypothetical protein